jgi:hypothetical protein
VAAHQSAVGRTGKLIVATRGPAGPGEVLIEIRGGTEAYLAWSEEPLPRGASVLVVNSREERAVDVIEWSDPFEDVGGPILGS